VKEESGKGVREENGKRGEGKGGRTLNPGCEILRTLMCWVQTGFHLCPIFEHTTTIIARFLMNKTPGTSPNFADETDG